ncbi:MAG TPA: dihydroorotate dehydrogenase electron transfer subunit [Egibacteraceae bacterium]
MSSIVSRGSTPSVQGRETGPLRAMCEVLAHNKIGAYHSLTFVAPDMAERTSPGQFVTVGVEGGGTLLRRPFSVYSVSQHGPWAGTLEIVFDVVGPGTAWLAEREKHDVVDVVGPLGRPFPMPQQPVACLLVGGGYGAAPLLFLAQILQRRGFRVDMILGARTQSRVFNAIEAKRIAASATFTTDDGSFGVQGAVTDVMDRVIETAGTGVIYACGPMPMLAAVSEVARAKNLPCQVAVEEQMACGVGVCMTCVLPYRRRDEVVNLRACIDGPVFNGARVQWDLIGRRPGDLASASQDEEFIP